VRGHAELLALYEQRLTFRPEITTHSRENHPGRRYCARDERVSTRLGTVRSTAKIRSRVLRLSCCAARPTALGASLLMTPREHQRRNVANLASWVLPALSKWGPYGISLDMA